MVQPWKSIPRVCVCQGYLQPDLTLAIQNGSKLQLVGTPLEPKVKDILKFAVASKFGKNSETLLDESVRKGREIGPEVLKFVSSKSNKSKPVDCTEEAIVELTKRLAGVIRSRLFPRAQSISLQLCKLAVYQEGGHFVEHKDTAHAPNHQGTLLIEVKSEHEGGKLIFTADDIAIGEWSLESEHTPAIKKSSFYYHHPTVRWCAFHTDITHKVEPVVSGVRAVLQFDILVQHCDSDAPQAKAADDAEGNGDDEAEEEDEQENDYDDDIDGGRGEGSNECEEAAAMMPNGHLGRTADTAVAAFIEKLEHAVAEQSIALPLFHSYHQAYLRPEFLKSVDRALFDALLKAGHSILLSPVIIRSTSDYEGRSYEYSVGPCDPYDVIYTIRRTASRDGSKQKPSSTLLLQCITSSRRACSAMSTSTKSTWNTRATRRRRRR